MKIDDISLTIFTWDNIPTTIYHQGSTAASGSNLGLLRIQTDDGLQGHAFLGSASNPASMDGPQLIRSLKPMLMGRNPLEREGIHAGMRLVNRTVSYRTIGAVDTALWDIAGKIAGLPVHALMGTYRTSIPAYASSQVLPDAAAYVDQAQAFKEAGWQAYKIHPPNKGGLTTMLKTAHLAEAFGLRYEVHHSGNSLNNLANLHLCMALRNTTMWEVLLPAGAHKYGMVKELEIDKNGLMHAPAAPGIGGDIDIELIARKTEAVLK
jgi:L-alanine-DL-glutamate epimerase-like enolase superfamily enzyme